MHWHKAISELASSGQPFVIATVLATSGSTPRPAGTKMVITPEREHDTLGGGNLEHLIIARARALLDVSQHEQARNDAQHIEHFPLAAAALQCCGGSVTVLFEVVAPPALQVAVFGAGHIGHRVVGLLEELGAAVSWVDDASRQPEGDLDEQTLATPLVRSSDPAEQLADLSPDTHIIIVTHDHQLDYSLLEKALLEQALLNAGQSGYASLGVIGSATKWQRFRTRLLAADLPATAVDAIRCPLGGGRSTDKQPMAIAIAIVAELLELSGQQQSAREAPENNSALTWQHIKSSLVRSSA